MLAITVKKITPGQLWGPRAWVHWSWNALLFEARSCFL